MFAADLLRVASGAIGLLGIGFVTGFSPTLVAETLRVLTGVKRPDRAIAYMLAGLVIGSGLLLFLLQFIDPRTLAGRLSAETEKILVSRGIDLVFGALFLVAGIVLALRARRPRKPAKPKRPPSGRPLEMALIGASSVTLSASSFATVYLAARLVHGLSSLAAVRALGALAFVIGLIALYVVLAAVWGRVPALAARITRLFDRVGSADLRPWEAGIVLIAAAILLWLGIAGEPGV